MSRVVWFAIYIYTTPCYGSRYTAWVDYVSVAFWILNWRRFCHCALVLVFDWKRMSLRTLSPLKHPEHLCSQGRVGPMTYGLLLTSTWNQDAAGVWPWCWWAGSLLPSLLPSCFQKLAIGLACSMFVMGANVWAKPELARGVRGHAPP